MLLLKNGRVLLGAVMLAGLAACATDADQYYSLQPTASNAAGPTSNRQGGFDYVVSVRPVQVPAQLDRSQIVLKGSSGDISVLNESLWASPLPDELRLAVSSELTQRLGVPDLPLPAVPDGLRVWLVNLDVQRFDSIYNTASVIDVTWRLQGQMPTTDKAPASVCRATISRSVGTGLAPLMNAHRDSLQVLGGLIAQQIAATQSQANISSIAPPAQVDAPGLVFRGCAQTKAS
ncbi:MAG: hypothetical protein CML16_15520 [Pusillimonas sp.]|nr:hypothetical protein [Pusillimonas sp.]MBC41864.1 hypothetical protein [Pusillimonas sp.]HCN71234.1 hypothetical protein [Pusillimonas sp.]